MSKILFNKRYMKTAGQLPKGSFFFAKKLPPRISVDVEKWGGSLGFMN